MESVDAFLQAVLYVGVSILIVTVIASWVVEGIAAILNDKDQ